MSKCLLTVEDFERWQRSIVFSEIHGEQMWIGERHYIRYIYEECCKQGIDPERVVALSRIRDWGEAYQMVTNE